jgi:hypothetical protein
MTEDQLAMLAVRAIEGERDAIKRLEVATRRLELILGTPGVICDACREKVKPLLQEGE